MTKQEQHQALLKKMEEASVHLPLCHAPTDIVIGNGNLEAEVMFIGEAPGENEALQRTPFVGRAGQLLNKTLAAQTDLKREDVYISNIVKARPPNNRDPLPEEIAAYLPYLQEEIALIQPILFVTLGRFSLNFFLPDARISAVHGVLQRFWWHGNITYVLPQYHPAAALRGTRMMEAFTADIAKIPAALKWVREQRENDQELVKVKQAFLDA